MPKALRAVVFLWMIVSLIAPSWALALEKDDSRIFWMPEYHGQRLAYCLMNGACGMDVAKRYCQLMGYEKATKAVKANNIGLANYLDKPFRCKGWECNGFNYIECASSIDHVPPSAYHYRKRLFVYPRLENYRVDWCYNGESGCGGKVAHSFCRRMGYLKANHYHKQEHVAATKAIGNQKLCFGQQCAAFSEIACYR